MKENSSKPDRYIPLTLISRLHFCRSLAVGTTSGYKLYSLSSTESLEPIYENGKPFDHYTTITKPMCTTYEKFCASKCNLKII